MKLTQQSFLLIVMFGCIVSCRVRETHHLSIEINSKTLTFGFHKKGKMIYGNENQTQFYNNLSRQFNFRLTIFNNDSNPFPSSSVLKIYTKDGVFLKKFETANSLMFPLSLDEVSSFETNVKYKSFGDDNIFGTLIIEDFNFDGLYDVALMRGCAINGNAFYQYYLQSDDSVFIEDIFLSRKVSTYPEERNVQKKQLTSSGISLRSCTKRTVQYNDSLKSWKKIKEVVYE